jgi:hypothetical protein
MNNPEQNLSYKQIKNKIYYMENLEKLKEYDKKYRDEHKEKLRE